jgi:hypothetical protein
MVNFGWEYVWHCHILGHEENDMMRAMILAVAPNAPLITRSQRAGSLVNLTWTEAPSPPYTGFTIQRSTNPAFPVGSGTTSFTVGPTPLSHTNTVPSAGPWYYRIMASNLVGYTRAYAAPAAGYPNVSSDSAWSPANTTATAAGPPRVVIDLPSAGATISGQTPMAGWAISYATGVGLPIGSVQVQVDGAFVGNATYGVARPDVCAAYPGRPSCPNVGYAYTLNASTLTPGLHTIRVVAFDTSAVPLNGSAQVQVTVVAAAPPKVVVDLPTAGATITGLTPVVGWAISNSGNPLSTVQVLVDGAFVANATYGAARPDVCAVYPGRPNCPNVGYTYTLNPNTLSAGLHTIRVVATDTSAVPLSSFAQVQVTVSVSAPPTVVIDIPSAGATIAASQPVVGWAISNSGNPLSTVRILVDGAAMGTATYGAARPDVCAAYPGRPGCPNVGYSYTLNATALSAGSHTIRVVATDTSLSPLSSFREVQVTR